MFRSFDHHQGVIKTYLKFLKTFLHVRSFDHHQGVIETYLKFLKTLLHVSVIRPSSLMMVE